MATIRDSVLQPIQVFEPNPRERALDALRAKLGREPTAEDIAEATAAELEANPLHVVTLPGEIPAGFPIAVSISADPAVKATTKASIK